MNTLKSYRMNVSMYALWAEPASLNLDRGSDSVNGQIHAAFYLFYNYHAMIWIVLPTASSFFVFLAKTATIQWKLTEEEGETKSRRRADVAAIKHGVCTDEATTQVFNLPVNNARCKHMSFKEWFGKKRIWQMLNVLRHFLELAPVFAWRVAEVGPGRNSITFVKAFMYVCMCPSVKNVFLHIISNDSTHTHWCLLRFGGGSVSVGAGQFGWRLVSFKSNVSFSNVVRHQFYCQHFLVFVMRE